MDRDIGISDASRMLGVSVSTLKRLCDEQLVPSIRTPGGHRRFDRTQVEMVGSRLTGQSTAWATQLNPNLVAQLTASLSASKPQSAISLLRAQVESDHQLSLVLDRYFRPALYSLMDSAPRGSIQENCVHRCAVEVLHQINSENAATNGGSPAFIGGSTGDLRADLGSHMVECALGSARARALHLTGPVAVEQFAKAAISLQVRGVWLADMAATPDLIANLKRLRALLPTTVRIIAFYSHSIAPDDCRRDSNDYIRYYESLQALTLDQSMNKDRL